MELNIAIDLIKPGVPVARDQLWWDLGAGSGLFTVALAKLLVEGSIVAVDKDTSVMRNIPDMIGQVVIKKVTTDFARLSLPQGNPTGVLMANSLHFVNEKMPLLTTLRSLLTPNGQLIIIEYDMNVPNAWVPFPIDFSSLSALAGTAGFTNVRKIGSTASRFQSNGIYSAVMANLGNF